MNWQSDDDSGEYDALDEYDGADFDNDELDEGSDLLDCPECGRAIYEFSERCPYCESYVTESALNRGGTSSSRIPQAAIVYLLIGALLLPFLLVVLRFLI